MARFTVAFALAIALFAGRAGAEEPQQDGTPVSHEPQPKKRYGAQVLVLDGAAIATMAIGVNEPAVFFPTYAFWGFSAPITHLARRNPGGAAISLGMRALASYAGVMAWRGGCHDDEQAHRLDCSEGLAQAMAIAALTSGLDAALLAYSTPAPPEPPTVDAPSPHREREPHRRERPPSRFSFLRVTPTVGAAPHGVFVGATGTF